MSPIFIYLANGDRAEKDKHCNLPVINIFVAPIALALMAQSTPMGPAPRISTVLPSLMPARLHAWIAIASGWTAAPSSIDRFSGILYS